MGGVADAHVGAASANIPGHRCVDIGIGRLWRLVQERRRGHDLPGLAITALNDLLVEPRLLHFATVRVFPVASIVVTGWEPIALTGSRQDRAGSPATCTVQAPH